MDSTRTVRVTLVSGIVLCAARALAQAPQNATDTGEGLVGNPDAFAIGTNLLGVTINLVLVLAAIVVLAWIFRRVQGFGQPAAGSLRVAATLPLGPKERILLLQIGDQQVVVGASPGGLQTLHVLDTPLTLAEPGAATTDDTSFRARLGAALSKAQS